MALSRLLEFLFSLHLGLFVHQTFLIQLIRQYVCLCLCACVLSSEDLENYAIEVKLGYISDIKQHQSFVNKSLWHSQCKRHIKVRIDSVRDFKRTFKCDQFYRFPVPLKRGINNPISFMRKYKDSKQATIELEITLEQFIDDNGKGKSINKSSIKIPINIEKGNVWQNRVIPFQPDGSNSKPHTFLSIKARARCSVFRYGSKCQTPCKPVYNKTHHYYCTEDGFTKCYPGFKDKFCGSIDKCVPNPCLHNGRCTDLTPRPGQSPSSVQYKCDCIREYTGSKCETPKPPCKLYGGLCKKGHCVNIKGKHGYKCKCKSGWMGKHCQYLIDECKSLKCMNGGLCVSKFRTNRLDKCDCNNTGYTGPRCKQDVNECSNQNWCKSNGTCLNTIGSFTCKCKYPAYGRTCEKCRFTPVNGKCTNSGIAKWSKERLPFIIALIVIFIVVSLIAPVILFLAYKMYTGKPFRQIARNVGSMVLKKK